MSSSGWPWHLFRPNLRSFVSPATAPKRRRSSLCSSASVTSGAAATNFSGRPRTARARAPMAAKALRRGAAGCAHPLHQLDRGRRADRETARGGADRAAALDPAHDGQAQVQANGTGMSTSSAGLNRYFVESRRNFHAIGFEATDFVLAAKPVNLVIDTVGGEMQRRSFAVIAPGGQAGFRSVGARRGIGRGGAGAGALFHCGRAVPGTERARCAVRGWYAQANIGEVSPLAEAPLAHEMLAGRPHRHSKIVLDVDARLQELLRFI
jgi:hypothetical protein